VGEGSVNLTPQRGRPHKQRVPVSRGCCTAVSCRASRRHTSKETPAATAQLSPAVQQSEGTDGNWHPAAQRSAAQRRAGQGLLCSPEGAAQAAAQAGGTPNAEGAVSSRVHSRRGSEGGGRRPSPPFVPPAAAGGSSSARAKSRLWEARVGEGRNRAQSKPTQTNPFGPQTHKNQQGSRTRRDTSRNISTLQLQQYHTCM
jgi:hypothetical protein